jgi:hypothetical protein
MAREGSLSGDWVGPPGGRKAFWANIAKSSEVFIRANDLKPARIGQSSAAAAKSVKAFIDLGIRGGIRVPHLHFDSKIYLLNNEQWAKFSGSIIADAKAKLAKVKEVSLQQAVALGSLTQELAGK